MINLESDFYDILYLSGSGKVVNLLKNILFIMLLIIILPCIISNGYGQMEPPPITGKCQAGSIDGKNWGECDDGPPLRPSNGIDNSDFDVAFIGAATIGIIAAIAGIGVAISKGNFGKSSQRNDQFTKSAQEHYQSDFTEKYLKPKYTGMGTYHAESAPPSPYEEPSFMINPNDINPVGKSPIGITNAPPTNPPPNNVTYKINPNSITLRWETPVKHDTSSEVKLLGYDVYYQVKTPTGWATQHVPRSLLETEYIIQNPNMTIQNFGVRTVFKGNDGSIFYSNGLSGNELK